MSDINSPRFCAATRQAHGNLIAALASGGNGDAHAEYAEPIRMFRNAYLADEKADGVDKDTAAANADAMIAKLIGNAGKA